MTCYGSFKEGNYHILELELMSCDLKAYLESLAKEKQWIDDLTVNDFLSQVKVTYRLLMLLLF